MSSLVFQLVLRNLWLYVFTFHIRYGGDPGGGDSVGPRTPTTPAPPRGLRPTVSCRRCCPQASMGAKGA